MTAPSINEEPLKFDFLVVFPRETQVWVVQKRDRFADKRGRGGRPHPPHHYFFKEGITPLPMSRCR